MKSLAIIAVARCVTVFSLAILVATGSATARDVYATKLTSPAIANAPAGTLYFAVEVHHSAPSLPTDGLYALAFRPDASELPASSGATHQGAIEDMLVYLIDRSGNQTLKASVTREMSPEMTITYSNGKIVSFDLRVDGGGNLIDRWLDYLNIRDEYGRMLLMNGDRAHKVSIGMPNQKTFAKRSRRIMAD